MNTGGVDYTIRTKLPFDLQGDGSIIATSESVERLTLPLSCGKSPSMEIKKFFTKVRHNSLHIMFLYDTMWVSYRNEAYKERHRMVTREADYAIRALLRLALQEDGQVLSTTVLSEEMEIPYRFLRKILLKLLEEGFVTSTRGKQGGLRLAKPPTTVSLLDIIQMMNPEAVLLNDCLADPDFCDRSERCVVHMALAEIQQELCKRVSEVSLATLVQREHQRLANNPR